MPSLNAQLTATKFLDISEGSQAALPSQNTFAPSWPNALEFFSGYNNVYYPSFVQETSYSDPNLTVKYYGISNTGFLQYEDTFNIGSGTFNEPYSVGLFGSEIWAVADAALNFVFLKETNININDGVVSGTLSLYGSGSVSNPYIGGGVAYFGMLHLGNNNVGSHVYYTDSGSNAEIMGFVVPDGIGGVDNLKIITIPDGSPYEFSNCWLSIYNNGRYRSLFTDFNNNEALTLIDFVPTNIGNADDAAIYDLTLDNSGLNTILKGGGITSFFTDGSNFYLLFDYDLGGNPIVPVIAKINFSWTQYEIYILRGVDSVTETLINNHLAGTEFLWNAYSPGDGKIFLTGGDNPPMYYGVGELVNATLGLQIPQPVSLPCQAPCVPFIDKRN